MFVVFLMTQTTILIIEKNCLRV